MSRDVPRSILPGTRRFCFRRCPEGPQTGRGTLSIRTIAVPFAAGLGPLSGLRGVVRLAGDIGAHLHAVFVRPDPEAAYVYTGMLPSDRAARDFRDRIDEVGRTAAEAARTSLEALCRDAGVAAVDVPDRILRPSWAWQERKGEAAVVVPEVAGEADLVAFTRGAAARTWLLAASLLEATLLRSGVPVLYLPDGDAVPDLSRPLLAWDGGPAAQRALSAWLSVGQPAKSATILHVAGADERPPALNAVSDRLAWHGIEARTEVLKQGDDSIAGKILTTASKAGCGIVVMGGYGRLRYAETLFGGATRDIIRTTGIPVLLMH